MARQFDPRPPAETDKYVNSFLPVVRSIPTNQLYPCYVLAMELRPVGNNYPITAIELVQAWKERQGSLEMKSLDTSRLLPENAASACPRCYKRRDGQGNIIECLEIHPDGSIGGLCDHRPLTEEEIKETTQKRVDFLADMQRQARERLEAKRQAELIEKEEEARPKEGRLLCPNRHRQVSTLMGWTEGEMCRNFLQDKSSVCPKCNQPTGVQSMTKMHCRECVESWDLILCDGVMGKRGEV